MERDGTGQLSTIYTYGNQRINSESYNNLTGIYTYDGRGSVSAVIGGYGDFRASYWYDGLGNVKSQIHGYGAFGSGKKYYGYNAEQYNPVTGNQNLRNRQVNIRRQRFLTEDTYIGDKTDTLSINRYIYGNDNPLKYKDPSGNSVLAPFEIISNAGIWLADKNITKGGGGVAGFVQENESAIRSVMQRASGMSSRIQGCSDNYGGTTIDVLNNATFLTGGLFGFRTINDANNNTIITTNYWTIHGLAGYANIYDEVFHNFTLTDNDKIYIGNEYTIWMWKGDYWNLGAGGEIGIYNGTGEAVSTTMSDNLGISITMEITDKNGNSIVNMKKEKTWIDNILGTDPNTNWWLTGWNPNAQGLTDEDLTVTGVLDFSKDDRTQKMYDDLIKTAQTETDSKIEPMGNHKIRIVW